MPQQQQPASSSQAAKRPGPLLSQKDGCWRPGAVKEHKAKACAKVGCWSHG
jgi:hypothetical protein